MMIISIDVVTVITARTLMLCKLSRLVSSSEAVPEHGRQPLSRSARKLGARQCGLQSRRRHVYWSTSADTQCGVR